jgi:hypothetical protein
LADAIIPDYAESTECVRRKFASLALQQSMVEEILLAVEHRTHLKAWKLGDMPSWMPRWNICLYSDFPFHHPLQEICRLEDVRVNPKIALSVLEVANLLRYSPLPISFLAIPSIH